MRKEIRLLIATSMLVNSCRPIVARAMEDSNATNDPKISTETPPITFTPEPTQIPTTFPTPFILGISTPEMVIAPDVLYFSQLRYPNEYFKDGSKWSFSGCGIMAGAMVDRTDPYIYYGNFLDYFAEQGKSGEERITRFGSLLEDHKAVLESLGHTFVQLSTQGKTPEEIKAEIKIYTDQGIPVWVKAHIWDGSDWYGHHTIVVEIDGERIVYNDPVYGERVKIAESAEEARSYNQNHWISLEEFYAVVPPGK